MFTSLPLEARQLIEYRFPDYLDADEVRHSDWSYTIVLLDLDYRYYTFRLNLSLDHRWTLAPISGFINESETNLLGKDDGWQAKSIAAVSGPKSTRTLIDTQT